MSCAHFWKADKPELLARVIASRSVSTFLVWKQNTRTLSAPSSRKMSFHRNAQSRFVEKERKGWHGPGEVVLHSSGMLHWTCGVHNLHAETNRQGDIADLKLPERRLVDPW